MHCTLNTLLLNAARQRIRATPAPFVLPVIMWVCEMKIFKVSETILLSVGALQQEHQSGSRCSIRTCPRGSKTSII